MLVTIRMLVALVLAHARLSAFLVNTAAEALVILIVAVVCFLLDDRRDVHDLDRKLIAIGQLATQRVVAAEMTA